MRKKKVVFRGRMIKVKGNHLRDLVRLRALKGVVPAPVLQVGVIVPRVRGEVVGSPEHPVFRGLESSSGTGAHLCRRCNNLHFGKCRRSNSACFTCGQLGHRAAQCPQNQ